ncbi:MAG TPA: alpha-amylase family protein [Chloroflexota bacterium]|nr:alpha-amylase family protein [Chloroflexota bacterium]
MTEMARARPAERPWWQQPLRISQTNLQARDTPKYRPEVFMRQLAEMGNNVAIANAGGIYAWYPTAVAEHTVNPYLEGRDFVRECVAAAHANGMHFVARVDFSLADDAIYARHPDWFARDRSGAPIIVGEPRPGPWGLLYYTCPNGPYRNEAVAFQVLRELLGRYELDGLFINAAGFRPCWCGSCARAYRRDAGAELPAEEDWRDANFRRWVEWRYDCLARNFGAMYATIQEVRPGCFWTSEFGAITSSRPWRGGQDLFRLKDGCTVITTASGDPIATGRPPCWLPAIHAKYARAISDPEVPWATVHPTAGLAWRHTGLPVDELRLWLAQVNAHGAYAWHAMTGTPDTHYDRRNLPIHAEFNAFLQRHEDAFRDTRPVTPVALLWSRRTLERYGAEAPEARYQDEFFGFCEALLGHGIPFTVVPEPFLQPHTLDAYDVLVLPNAACLGDEAAAAVARFAGAGKGVVASFATGLFDEDARPREHGVLQDVLGVRFTGHTIGGQHASYARIERPAHPLFAGSGETQLLPNEFSFCHVAPSPGAQVLLTLVPPFAPAGGVGAPPERASIPTDHTEIPLAVQQGRTIYFANEIGKMAWRFRLPDHTRLIAAAVRAVLPRPFPAELLDAPYGVQLSLSCQEQPARLLCHVINSCGAGTVRHQAIPVHGLRLRLPLETRRASALAAGVSLTLEDGVVAVPPVHTWEVVVAEL